MYETDQIKVTSCDIAKSGVAGYELCYVSADGTMAMRIRCCLRTREVATFGKGLRLGLEIGELSVLDSYRAINLG